MPTTLAVPHAVISKRAIRWHYDLATPFYRLLWGPHIHHGFWEAQEASRVAQEQLIDRLADAVDVGEGNAVLDVGCGMGGSSLRLAERWHCDVTGITLSPVQRAWASLAARWHGLRDRARFICRDVEATDFGSGAFDVVWSIECTEHLFDKAGFFTRAASWLRPGGRMAICAWQASNGPRSAAADSLLRQVCEGFLCPSLGSMEGYLRWMRDAGLEIRCSADLTSQVMQTWRICRERVQRSRVQWLARCAGRDMRSFLQHFDTILNAYATGAMRYGLIVAQRPLTS